MSSESPSPATILRRFLLWAFICTMSAIPSFLIARDVHVNVPGMVAGVALFVILYTWFTSTRRFERFYRRPFVRETMYVGYVLRVLLSGLVLLLYLNDRDLKGGFAFVPDLWLGAVSALFGQLIGLGIENGSAMRGVTTPHTFIAAFVTTCIQGVLLNILVSIVMGIAYVAQRVFRPWPDDDHNVRGFEVLRVAAAEAE